MKVQNGNSEVWIKMVGDGDDGWMDLAELGRKDP